MIIYNNWQHMFSSHMAHLGTILMSQPHRGLAFKVGSSAPGTSVLEVEGSFHPAKVISLNESIEKPFFCTMK